MSDMKFYTVQEVADILRMTPMTIYTYVNQGTLKAIKIGRHWKIRHEDLDAFLEARTNTADQK